MNKPNRVTIHLTDDGYERLMKEAAAEGESIPDYIRKVINTHRQIAQHADEAGMVMVTNSANREVLIQVRDVH